MSTQVQLTQVFVTQIVTAAFDQSDGLDCPMKGAYKMEKGQGALAKIKTDPNESIAYDLLSARPRSTSTDLLEMYAENDFESHVPEYEFDTGRPTANVLYMSELLIGHQDSAVDFFMDTINRVKSMPEDMKPDVVVLSGLMQGDFKFLDKPRRSTLVPGLEGMDEQFRHAREMLDLAGSLGKPVIYNMSNDDRRIAEDYTIEVFRKMGAYAKHHDRDKGGVKSEDRTNWAMVDKMRQNPNWNAHLRFQIDTVFPYCLRAGRRLYTAEEMSQQTDGLLDKEEYFVLYDIEQRMHEGRRLSNKEYRWLRRAHEEQVSNLIITDDVNLHINTTGRQYTDWVRHNFGFSDKPMYKTHMKPMVETVLQLEANGEDTPDMMVVQHNQEEVGVDAHGSWIVSTGGMIDARNHVSTRGSLANAAGDTSKRLVRTRRRISSPSASMHERTDDGRHIVTFLNDKLYEKSFSIPERMSIAEICDLQIGSITARPDLLVKYLDYIRTRALGEQATALFFGGDMLHGRNYPNFPMESQQTGLMAMDSQETFLTSVFRGAFADMSPAELAAIKQVLVQPGNHEWNSGTLKWHGYSFVTYMRNFFEKSLARGGYSDEEIDKIVKTHDAVITPHGDYASGYTGIGYFGAMGVLLQHYLLDKGAKGSGGDLPVYQSHDFATGAGDLMQSIDILMAGHWHHPQYGMFGDKIGLVGGSIAGLSDYELKRGYRPSIAGTVIHIGGGLPPQLEFISKQALQNHIVQKGQFSKGHLTDEGYTDDEDFDPEMHGIYLPDRFAKSALQKKILQLQRDASQRTNSLAEIR